MPTPREFFTEYVIRSFEEFRAKPHDIYLAMNAVRHANVMAEHMFRYYAYTAPDRVYYAKEPSDYRRKLADVCPDFALVRDVADGFKHVQLSMPDRRVTHADQTGSKLAAWINNAGKEVMWTDATGEEVTWRTKVVVELDDGPERPLLPALIAVVALWERLTESASQAHPQAPPHG